MIDLTGARIRFADAVGALPVGNGVECGEPHGDAQPWNRSTDPLDHRPHEPGAVLQGAAIPPLARARPQQLVPQIAVTGLDVHECEPGAVRQTGRRDEVVHQHVELVVGQDPDPARHTLIQDGMRAARHRLGAVEHIGAAPAAGMRELKTDEQIAVRTRTVSLPVCGNELVAQAGDERLRGRREQQLVRIRTAVVPDGHRFPTPDQLGSA